MVEVAVTLPEPRPEDDEDVVWGLSTAAALWARGERVDAVVWLRRAAEAASAAGQEERSTEIGVFVVRIEHARQEIERHAATTGASPPNPAAGATVPAVDGGALLPPKPPVDIAVRSPSKPPPVAGPVSPEGDRNSGPYEEIEVEPVPPPPPAPPRAGTIRPPAGELPALAGFGAPKAPVTTAPHPAPPPGPAHEPVVPSGSAVETLGAAAPVAPEPVKVQVARPASIPPPPPPRAPMPSSYPGVRKTAGPRVPILDPWAEEPSSPHLRLDALIRSVQVEGDEVVLQMRRSASRVIDEDDVVTSAAPLDATLRRGSKPPALTTRKVTATGEQPPGHIADAGAGVAIKGAPSKPTAHDGGHTPPKPPPPVTAPMSRAEPAAASKPEPAETSKPHSAPTVPMPSSRAAPKLEPAETGAAPSHGPVESLKPAPATAPEKPAVPAMASPAPAESIKPPVASPEAASASPVDAGTSPAPPRNPVEARRVAVTVPSFMFGKSASPGAPHPQPPASATPLKPAPAPAPNKPHVPSIPAPRPTTPPPGAAPASLNPADVPTQPMAPSPIPRPRRPTVPPPAGASVPKVAATLPVVAPAAPSTPTRPPPALDTLAPPAPRLVPRPTGKTAPPPAPRAAPSMAPAPPAPRAAPAPSGAAPGALDPAALEHVSSLADVPADMRALLVTRARVDALGPDDEASGFAAALVIEGSVSVCATIVDEPIAHAASGTLVPISGTFPGGVALRVVAGPAGARVAVWEQPVLDEALHACSWVLEELKGEADRLQALAGATMGPLGELDEAVREQVLSRLTVRAAPARAEVDTEPAIALVCLGSVEVQTKGAAAPIVVRAGEALLPRADIGEARAGAHGALLLVGDALSEELAANPTLSALFAQR